MTEEILNQISLACGEALNQINPVNRQRALELLNTKLITLKENGEYWLYIGESGNTFELDNFDSMVNDIILTLQDIDPTIE